MEARRKRSRSFKVSFDWVCGNWVVVHQICTFATKPYGKLRRTSFKSFANTDILSCWLNSVPFSSLYGYVGGWHKVSPIWSPKPFLAISKQYWRAKCLKWQKENNFVGLAFGNYGVFKSKIVKHIDESHKSLIKRRFVVLEELRIWIVKL